MGEHHLFVYGSLMRGFQYHDLLTGAVFLRPATTAPVWTLLDLGRYPAVVEGEQCIEGELYRVSTALLAEVDQLEGCPELYRRELAAMDDGAEAFIYCLQPRHVPRPLPVIPGGSWRDYRQRG